MNITHTANWLLCVCVCVWVSECVCVGGWGSVWFPGILPHTVFPYRISESTFVQSLFIFYLPPLSRENYKCLCPANNQDSLQLELEFIEEESIFLSLPDSYLQKQRKWLCGEAARGTCLWSPPKSVFPSAFLLGLGIVRVQLCRN